MDDRLASLCFSLFPGIGPVRFAHLVGAFGAAKEAWTASIEDLQHYIGIPGAISVGPTARIIMQCYKEDLKAVVSAIVEIHPYEEPVIEVTKLEKESIFSIHEGNAYPKKILDACVHCMKYPIVKNYTNRDIDS